MSTYAEFPNLPAALEAFASQRCRRHVRIDGHVIDLVQAGTPCEVQRPGTEGADDDDSFCAMLIMDGTSARAATAEEWDAYVRRAIADDLAIASPSAIELPPLAEPEVPTAASPLPKLCPCCLQPLPGGVL